MILNLDGLDRLVQLEVLKLRGGNNSLILSNFPESLEKFECLNTFVSSLPTVISFNSNHRAFRLGADLCRFLCRVRTLDYSPDDAGTFGNWKRRSAFRRFPGNIEPTGQLETTEDRMFDESAYKRDYFRND